MGTNTEPTAMTKAEQSSDRKATKTGTPDSAKSVSSAETAASMSSAGQSGAAIQERREAEKTTSSTNLSAVTTTDEKEESTKFSPMQTSLIQPLGENPDLPKIDINSFNVIKALVVQFRKQQGSSTETQQVTSLCLSI